MSSPKKKKILFFYMGGPRPHALLWGATI